MVSLPLGKEGGGGEEGEVAEVSGVFEADQKEWGRRRRRREGWLR